MSGRATWTALAAAAYSGFKGPLAGDWLQAQGLPMPPQANAWIPWPAGEGLIARLGSREFFVDASAPAIAGLERSLAGASDGVYPVLRADAAFALEGAGAEAVLAQVCNVDFAALDLSLAPIVMTLMIGVAVLVLPQQRGAQRRYRIWCDPSFGEYLDHELSAITDTDGSSSITGAQP